MKVKVLQEKCGTVGRCVIICPDLFRFQEGSKKAEALFEEVPVSLQKKCIEAAEACPNKAIAVLY